MLAEADNVADILAVQDRITAVQIEIEQVQGQQKLLEDQTAFGTLAITLGEPGAEIIEVEPSRRRRPRRRVGRRPSSLRRQRRDDRVVVGLGRGGARRRPGRRCSSSASLWVGMRRRLV